MEALYLNVLYVTKCHCLWQAVFCLGGRCNANLSQDTSHWIAYPPSPSSGLFQVVGMNAAGRSPVVLSMDLCWTSLRCQDFFLTSKLDKWADHPHRCIPRPPILRWHFAPISLLQPQDVPITMGQATTRIGPLGWHDRNHRSPYIQQTDALLGEEDICEKHLENQWRRAL